MKAPTIQQIHDIHGICQSPAYRYIIDTLEKELNDDIEGRMEKADTLSGSLHGEWKTARRLIRRLRGFADEYAAKWDSRIGSNPSVLGAMSANRVVEDETSVSGL